MSILDLPNEFTFSGDTMFLPTPLISKPVENLELISDIYCVGNAPIERWRCFIDCKNWSPKQYHDKKLNQRAYHARMVWETQVLLSFTDETFIVNKQIQMISAVASFELRVVEFEIMGFQLTCGMLGIAGIQRDLYTAAVMLYTTVLWMSNHLGNKTKVKAQQELISHIRENKPFSVDSPKNLCIIIDTFITAINEFLKHHNVSISDSLREIEDIENISSKLRNSILAFDKVAKIL